MSRLLAVRQTLEVQPFHADAGTKATAQLCDYLLGSHRLVADVHFSQNRAYLTLCCVHLLNSLCNNLVPQPKVICTCI